MPDVDVVGTKRVVVLALGDGFVCLIGVQRDVRPGEVVSGFVSFSVGFLGGVGDGVGELFVECVSDGSVAGGDFVVEFDGAIFIVVGPFV